MPVDVESELARLGVAWNATVAHVDVVEVLERTMTTRSPDDIIDPSATRHERMHIEPRRRRSGQRWLVAAACVAFLAAGAVALAQRRDDRLEPASTNPATTPTLPIDTTAPPAPEPFVGVWLSTDTDGSSQTMEIVPFGDEYEVVVRDDAATAACAGAASTMTGIGLLEADDRLVIAQPELTCDNGTVPSMGPPPQAELADFAFDRDPVADELTDRFGVVWSRAGSTDTDNTASPTTSVEPAAPPGTTEARQAVIGRLIEALNTTSVDDAADHTGLRDVFTDDATIRPFDGWEHRPISDPLVLEEWILQLRTWGFDGALRSPGCGTEQQMLYCWVRVRWPVLLAEADERWQVDFVGDRIQTLTVTGAGQRYGDPTLALSVAELVRWEEWLTDTDPETAATLISSGESAAASVSRYDPGLAVEYTASIQLYVQTRPPEKINVTADLVEFTDRLYGFIDNMDRADGYTYVMAGRYETEGDLGRRPEEEAVLAAFDDAGRELWRTELDEAPSQVVAFAGDVWVLHGTGKLSQIDASDGRLIDRVTVAAASNPDSTSLIDAFGSLWVHVTGWNGVPGQLIRVHPDLSTTTIELPTSLIGMDGEYNPAAGAGGIWVPLGHAGVAVADVQTGQVKVISVDDIGHYGRDIAVDGDVVYVSSGLQEVTSIVDGQVSATVNPGNIHRFGRVEGVFGAKTTEGFVVLRANDPMKVEVRQSTTGGWYAGEIDGETWMVESGGNRNLRRVQFLPEPETGAG